MCSHFQCRLADSINFQSESLTHVFTYNFGSYKLQFRRNVFLTVSASTYYPCICQPSYIILRSGAAMKSSSQSSNQQLRILRSQSRRQIQRTLKIQERVRASANSGARVEQSILSGENSQLRLLSRPLFVCTETAVLRPSQLSHPRARQPQAVDNQEKRRGQ